jgi:hypothetical protein
VHCQGISTSTIHVVHSFLLCVLLEAGECQQQQDTTANILAGHGRTLMVADNKMQRDKLMTDNQAVESIGLQFPAGPRGTACLSGCRWLAGGSAG